MRPRGGETQSPSQPVGVQAVTFDFYNTLAYPRAGRGRGVMLMEYLGHAGLESDPWEHQALYDVFEPHACEYSPAQSAEARRHYLVRFAERVFDRLRVRGPGAVATDHAHELWRLLGPESLTLYPDVRPTLERLRERGLPVAVVSNWQCGLGHFCTDLGIGGLLDAVIASAEVGSAKPEPEIFHEACLRLGVDAAETLHVGDSVVDDLRGAHEAGLQAVLVMRDPDPGDTGPSISGLSEVLGLCAPEV